MISPDIALMQTIRAHWQEDLAEVVSGNVIPVAFLAALVANETGGSPDVVRFEPAVFRDLSLVILGKTKAYSPAGIAHPLVRSELLTYVEPSALTDFTNCLERLAELATSRGLTQIMGWHAVEMSRVMPGPVLMPIYFLHFTVDLLVYFANRYKLDQSRDFPELLRCWNCGRPDGTTFDPHYVSNGLNRMETYAQLERDAAG